MNTLTLKIPHPLEAALQAASTRRNISKSAVVREALETVLAEDLKAAEPAAQWLGRWRGVMGGPKPSGPDDELSAHILKKHLR